ncbi:MD-2-related lipid-recognition domain-containing protein [Caenorhabditis elegans]|uniref:MD-2-related lipid-recognition domain-containing protein n=1 Tax=Caenorhabditis elegans TaxID=6239 RepID=Q9BKP8_CAEEL|nr:MD-2-related lipid-recognition domain-containing protein [Caenorhabditis elegans]CCD64911.1 MD-2-related lipid-recognition domain-containing protein [Caenorhabditis elegans]|eukprot:NP_494487.1 Uncharacterized protein CELE_C17F4.7 [Caenorhabditis elegans]
MLSVLFLLLVGAFTIGANPVNFADCPFPNGTDKAIHSYMCSDNEQFSITDIQTLDSNQKPYYPIDPRHPFILNLTTYNHGEQIDDNKVKVKINQYKSGWTGGCSWKSIPTFGLLDDIDGCDFAHNCPLESGPLFLILPLDLSQFSVIIELLAAHKPYELEIRMFNHNPGNTKHEEIACVMAQLELS